MSKDSRLAAGACGRPEKVPKMTRSCEESSTTPSAAAFSALLAEQADLKNRLGALALERKCIPGLAAAVKELQEKLADREKIETTVETSPRA